jgi:hypothetical protein
VLEVTLVVEVEDVLDKDDEAHLRKFGVFVNAGIAVPNLLRL